MWIKHHICTQRPRKGMSKRPVQRMMGVKEKDDGRAPDLVSQQARVCIDAPMGSYLQHGQDLQVCRFCSIAQSA